MSVRREAAIPIGERVTFAWRAVAEHGMLLCLLGVFVLIGAGVVYLATQFDLGWPVFVFGWVFVVFPAGIGVFTLPSSVLFYYEKQVIAKYGRRKEAVVVAARVEDLSGAEDKSPVLLYYFDYAFECRSIKHMGQFYLDDRDLAARISVGDLVPIKFLATDPETNDVRMRSLLDKLKED